MITVVESPDRREISDSKSRRPLITDFLTLETVLPATLQELDDAARRHGSRLVAVASRYLPCDADATDAVQDAFILALRHMHNFRGTCKLETWLHRIVVNACLMKRRANSRRRSVSIDDLWSDLKAPSERDSEIHSEALLTLRSALNQLPERQRAVIQLRYFEGFDTAQTAELLGINASAVKTRLHRSCRALRHMLDRVSDASY